MRLGYSRGRCANFLAAEVLIGEEKPFPNLMLRLTSGLITKDAANDFMENTARKPRASFQTDPDNNQTHG